MWVIVLSLWNPTLLGCVAANCLRLFHTAQVCKSYPVKKLCAHPALVRSLRLSRPGPSPAARTPWH